MRNAGDSGQELLVGRTRPYKKPLRSNVVDLSKIRDLQIASSEGGCVPMITLLPFA